MNIKTEELLNLLGNKMQDYARTNGQAEDITLSFEEAEELLERLTNLSILEENNE